MSKKKDTPKQLRYDRRKDPNTNCFRDSDGSYVYTIDVKVGKHWEKREVLRFNPDDYENGAEIFLALAENDRIEDEQEEDLNEHVDKVFQKKLDKYDSSTDETQVVNPWDEVAASLDETDILDQIDPEEKPLNPQIAKAEAFVATLEPQQADMVYDHLGLQKSLADIRREELAAGKKVTQQGISHRWDRILTKGCQFFDVPKPRKRKSAEA